MAMAPKTRRMGKRKLDDMKEDCPRMENRKWEDMNEDYLVNIFGRLTLESRLLDIRLVCKSWNRTLHNPLCWQQLVFPASIAGSRFARSHGLINCVVNRSQRCATTLVLPSDCSREELIYVSDKCPALKKLTLPRSLCDNYSDIIPSLIVMWKNLEFLTLGTSSFIVQILELIRIHLPNLSGLSVTSGCINRENALAIVSLSPKLKYLILEGIDLYRENLVLILQGCKQLVELDVQNCTGFDEDDEEIDELASGIKKFHSYGSMAEGYVWDDYVGLYDDYDPDENHFDVDAFIDYYTL